MRKSFAKHGIPLEPPKTIDDLVLLSEQLNGLDHNDDGIPDWGFCLTPQPNYFYAFAAPVLQTRLVDDQGFRTGDNIFFDPHTFRPRIRNDGFRYALEMYQRIIASSNCQYQISRGQKCSRKTAFPTGRCAGVISMPGTLTKMLRHGAKYAPVDRVNDTTGEVEWRVGASLPDGRYFGRRAPFPGSRRVVDFSKPGNPLVDCDVRTCPNAIDGINYAPFFSEAGEGYALNGKQSKQNSVDALWDLFVWLSQLPTPKLPLSGSYRKSHLDPSHADVLREEGWPEVMILDLFDVLSSYFNSPNPAQDLFVKGFSEYMSAFDEEIHENFLLQDLGVDVSSNAFDAKYNSFVATLEERYDAISKKQTGGELGQLMQWRESLNMQWKSIDELCSELIDRDLSRFESIGCASAVALGTFCAKHAPQVEKISPGICTDGSATTIAVSVAASVLGAMLIFIMSLTGYRRYKKYKKITKMHEAEMEACVDSAILTTKRLVFPLYLVSATDFAAGGSLQQHETLRAKKQLTVHDSISQVDAF